MFEASPELLDQRPLEPVGERHVDLLADDRPDKRLEGAGHDERAEAARALDQRAEALIGQGQGIQGRQVIVDPEAVGDFGRRGFQLGRAGRAVEQRHPQGGLLGVALGAHLDEARAALERQRPAIHSGLDDVEHLEGRAPQVGQRQIEAERWSRQECAGLDGTMGGDGMHGVKQDASGSIGWHWMSAARLIPRSGSRRSR